MFQPFPPEEADLRLRRTLDLIERGEIPREGIFAAREGDRILGCCVCVPMAGASALVWPPALVEDSRRAELEDALLQTGLQWLHNLGVKVAQALLPSEDDHRGGALERNGIHFTTRLLYLRHDLALFAPSALPADQLPLSFVSYAEADRDTFHETLLRTYRGSLDCPELDGTRSVEEIVAGHQAHGHFDPTRWWLVRAAERPVGVLLLNAMPEPDGWDLGYLGVIPEARGRGIGRALTVKALDAARAGGATQLTLSVDQRNFPARLLYGSLGFEIYDQRNVYLAILGIS